MDEITVGIHTPAGNEAMSPSPEACGSSAETKNESGFTRQDDDWLIWQLLDSAFPVGGFGHSGGLEAAWQLGEISDAAALRSYLESSLHQAARFALPLVHAAHREPERFGEWDELCEVWLTHHVANRASRAQGRAFWTAVRRSCLPALGTAPDPGHWPPVFGNLSARLGIQAATCSRMFLFLHLRGLVSAAVRLGIVGPLEAQAIQYQLGAVSQRLAALAQSWSVDDIAQTHPLLEIWQGAQDRLYSRLFQS